MTWVLVIYVIGVIANLVMEYKMSEDKVTVENILAGLLFSLFSWILFPLFLIDKFGSKEIQIKNSNKSNKLKVR